MEFMLNEKGRRLLVHDNYKFYKQHNAQEGLKWICIGRKCLGKIYTDEKATVMLKTDLNDNHERDTNMKRQVISAVQLAEPAGFPRVQLACGLKSSAVKLAPFPIHRVQLTNCRFVHPVSSFRLTTGGARCEWN
ncbi:hypothetical protein AVEN_20529-1 [Araneus ventricosus]|uniref:FLYWCH-type domain-containing protein n=1 Tax=Araneus ventricosus TaxID=182803 RepID=A0A4Y2TYU6_ARAVE|nr:hypothetical protein AVEN_198085-1 [Araneus ventricosus]GBO04506.1 hypothetical protein AVEN_20529-1 [Araneus ventricosus]